MMRKWQHHNTAARITVCMNVREAIHKHKNEHRIAFHTSCGKHKPIELLFHYSNAIGAMEKCFTKFDLNRLPEKSDTAVARRECRQ